LSLTLFALRVSCRTPFSYMSMMQEPLPTGASRNRAEDNARYERRRRPQLAGLYCA